MGLSMAVAIAVDDRWVVGYGLDWGGLCRNLPSISFVDNS
jgi:hypoxanthine-guanine phosphoribosyltransferase